MQIVHRQWGALGVGQKTVAISVPDPVQLAGAAVMELLDAGIDGARSRVRPSPAVESIHRSLARGIQARAARDDLMRGRADRLPRSRVVERLAVCNATPGWAPLARLFAGCRIFII